MSARTGKTLIGRCNFRGNEQRFGINQTDRRQHTYVIGKTGTGKTTLLENMVLQDIREGRGLGLIDPHGEFAERILAQIPLDRAEDVVYFNPVDSDWPIGFNILDVPDPEYKHLVVSDLMGIFTKVWANVWSARMEYILQNCILALLDTPDTTLLGVPRILTDKDYRQKIVANVKDPVVRAFWTHEFEQWRDQFRNEAIVPIQNKVGQFLNTSFIRNIVGQAKSRLHIPKIMNEGKIFIVNVSKGKLGEDNSALLGAMIITKIQLAAMERVRISEEKRIDFYLYVDEFQNFATDSFASILSEARKYRLNLIIAHQYIGQLVTDVSMSTKVRDAVFGNVGTMITFRVGATDAEFLEKEFTPEFMMDDLINLPNFHIYLKLMVDGVNSRPFSAITLPPIPKEENPATTAELINASRQNYAMPRHEVEAEITNWSGLTMGPMHNTDVQEKHETPCWHCGKTATVPFRPDGKRPIYCSSCLKLIEEKKIVPLPERMPQVGRARFGSSLGEIGIEFGDVSEAPTVEGKTSAPSPRRPLDRAQPPRWSAETRDREPGRYRASHPQDRPRPGPQTRTWSRNAPSNEPVRPGIRSRPITRASDQTHALPLKTLRFEALTPGPKKPGDAKTVNLSELRSALAEALVNTPDSPSASSAPVREREPHVMQPGEKIRL